MRALERKVTGVTVSCEMHAKLNLIYVTKIGRTKVKNLLCGHKPADLNP